MKTNHSPLSREMLSALLRIRRFEERLLALFSLGRLNGTTHTCIGQEEIPVAMMPLINDDDFVFSNHRGHGHYLARFWDMEGLLAEIMGREGAVCGGAGGSQHIRRGNYFSTGVQGESLPVGVGAAWQLKRAKGGRVAVTFIGDGTWGQGAVYEALNMAALWRVPLIVVVENNGIAQTTAREHNMAGSIEDRVRAFGVAYLGVPAGDFSESRASIAAAVDQVRQQGTPLVIEFQTSRLGSHSKGDDTRPKALMESLWMNDWYTRAKGETPGLVAEIDAEVAEQIDHVVAHIESRPLASPRVFGRRLLGGSVSNWVFPAEERVVENLNRALHCLLASDERYIFIGEDVLDPYGGAFKVARGLSSAYPERVVSTPISELGFAGFANGLALAGQRPIVEFMFGDFIFLACDQIINFAAKTVTMYGEHRPHPILFRCPVGGHRGYGATHSQSVQKHFIGIPNLDLYEMSPFHDCARLLPAVFDLGNPAILFESKVMYSQRMLPEGPIDELFSMSLLDPWTACVTIEKSTRILVVTTGGMFNSCWKAARRLFLEHEIEVAILVPFRLYPFDTSSLRDMMPVVEAVFTVEESTAGGTWGSEVASALTQAFPTLKARITQVHSKDLVIPSALHLEGEVLVTSDTIVQQISSAQRV